MTTDISAAARTAHHFIPFIQGSHLPSESESRLDGIRSGLPLARVYRHDSRPWWGLVEEEKVYGAISDDLFQSFVRLICATA